MHGIRRSLKSQERACRAYADFRLPSGFGFDFGFACGATK